MKELISQAQREWRVKETEELNQLNNQIKTMRNLKLEYFKNQHIKELVPKIIAKLDERVKEINDGHYTHKNSGRVIRYRLGQDTTA